MILVLTQCYPPDQGGIETLMGGLVEALRRAGKDVHVLADRIRSKKAASSQPVQEQGTERFGGIRPWRRWLKRRRAAQILRQGHVEAVIADSWKSLETLPDLKSLSVNSPVLVMIYGMEFPFQMSAGKSRRIKRALDKASTVIPISRFSADLARPFCDQSRMVMVHPPLPDMPEPDEAMRAQVLGLLGATASPRLLTLSRLEPRKGVDQVIRSLPALVRDYPDLVYFVGGGGADRARLETLAQDLGVASHVRFLGFVPEGLKPALYEAVDVFAMPVRREGDSVEGFGIVYMEAAYYGTPSLAGSEGGAVDAVLDGKTGLVVDGLDVDAITAQLDRLCGDRELRHRLGGAARERARHEFAWSHAVKTYLALCEKPL